MIGETLSHYRVLERLGSGGMGEVFVAEDLRLRRRVALKLLAPEVVADPRSMARLEREARTLARLQHPSIVSIHGLEEDRGVRFLAMELVEGRRLSEVIPRHGLPLERILEVAIPVADALAAAHEAGIVHRDLKPGNVMVTPGGGVKVLDFGLATSVARAGEVDASAETLTADGTAVGTLPYMSPEQLRGRPADPRSDLFSFGVMLFEMASGERPFRGESGADLAGAILRGDPPSVASLRPGLPHDLERIVGHCLQKDPERRYQTAKGLRNELMELREAQRNGSEAPAAALPRRRLLWPLGATIALLAVALALALWRGGWPDRREPPVETTEARAFLDQAAVYEARGDTPANLEHAERALRRALEREPENPYLRARLAALLALVHQRYPAAGRQEEIETLVESALASNVGLAPAWEAKGRLALLRGDWAEAERAARRARQLDPMAHASYAILGEALVAQGRVDDAVREAEAGLAKKGGQVWGRLALARVLRKAGRLNEAAAEYEKVLEYVPDSPSALNNLGIIYAMTGRDVAAVPLFRRLLELKPDDTAASNLGAVLFNLGRYEEAAAAFSEAHRMMPDHPSHERNLADVYEALGDAAKSRSWLEQALEDYDRAIQGGGPQPQLLSERAVAAAKLGRAEEARRDLAEARSRLPGDPTVLFYAAQVSALFQDRGELFPLIEEALAAGYPRDAFHSDQIFAAYREDPRFRELVLGEPPSSSTLRVNGAQ